MVLLSTHNICFGWEIWKLVFRYSLLTKVLMLCNLKNTMSLWPCSPLKNIMNNLRVEMGRDARKPVFGVVEQQRRRPACASAQTDQRLCYALFGKYHNVNLIQVKFKFSSWSQKLRRKVSNSLCRQPRRQVFSRGGPNNPSFNNETIDCRDPSLDFDSLTKF